MAVPRCAWGRSRRTPVPTPHSEGQPPRLATPAVGPLRHLGSLKCFVSAWAGPGFWRPEHQCPENQGEQGGKNECASQAVETSRKRARCVLQPPNRKRADNAAQAPGVVDERQATRGRDAGEEFRRDTEERRTSRAEPSERDGET